MTRGLLARHRELTHHSTLLHRSGAWERWQRTDSRLTVFASLNDLTQTWVASRSVPCYTAIAALAALGSRRGSDDDDASFAVIVALHRDIDHVADQLRRICDPDDVLRAVWDAVKRAEPQLDCRAPYFLLHRAKESLVTAHRRTIRELPCPAPFGDGDINGLALVGVQPETIPGGYDEVASDDLTGFLRWAADAGVIALEDAQLVYDVYRGLERRSGVEESLRQAGGRLGVGMRTVRRRRDITVRRLREAMPDFVAAAS